MFGELRPLVHFDGELLMVSFVVRMYLFGGVGWGGGRADCHIGGVGHIIGLQGKHAIHC